MDTEKSTNPERIVGLLRTEPELTKQEIAARLHLSMPTALQNINRMLEAGFLEECGETASTGGRRAKKLRLKKDAGYGVGINIALHRMELAVTDLLGETLRFADFPVVFEDTPACYEEIGARLEEFLEGIDRSRVLGAGVAFPGIIDREAGRIVRSHIFGLEHVRLDRFEKNIPFPLVVENEANCACFAERSAAHGTYLYLSLNESVGGAVMLDGQLLRGDSFQTGEFGHMLLVPGGKTCYCGKAGCADAYLSPRVLTGGTQTLEAFFARVRAGEPEAQAAWDEYLEYLSILCTNLRMAFNLDIVLGGEVGACLAPDLPVLCRKAAQYDRFARDVEYLFACRRTEDAFAAGAAMLAAERYSGRLFAQD
ncbi:MAG: ROK family protein [Butyricicoccus sp.]